MKSIRPFTFSIACLSLGLASLLTPATAQGQPNAGPAKTAQAELFPDKVVAKGKGVEVKSSEIEAALVAYKANRAASGQAVPPRMDRELEGQILDRLIATKLFIAKATPPDHAAAKEIAGQFLAESRKKAASEESFNRQLLATGMTPETFRKQVEEQAVVKAVIDRELKPRQKITEEQIATFYKENPKFFEEPEKFRVTHVLIDTREATTREEMSPTKKAQKRAIIEKVLTRAKAGEDFKKLVAEFSEDENSNKKDGEYLFAKGQLPGEFEAAASSLQPNQISEVVTSKFGFHVIKLLEKIPAQVMPLDKSSDRIRETLIHEGVQKDLPTYITGLKTEAEVVIVAP